MNSALSLGSLFLEGLLSFFSPCVLPLIPLFIGYLTADTELTDANGTVKHNRIKTLVNTLCFVLGICTVFVLAAIGTTAFSSFFNNHSTELSIIGGILLIFFGLISLGLIKIPSLEKEYRINVTKRSRFSWLNAWIMGFFFSFAWSPCIGPMLGSALVVAANASTKLMGYLDVAVYALGFVIMFILIGLFTEEVLGFIKKKQNVVKYTQKIGGVLIMIMGVYMLYTSFRSINQVQSTTTAAASTAESTAAPQATADTRTDVEKYGFTLKDHDGNSISLSDYSGKTVVIDFFATWCTYCKEELPHLQELNDTRDDVKIILIATPNYGNEGDEDSIAKFMSDNGYTMTTLYDADHSVTSSFGVSGYPTSYLVQPDGYFYGYIPGYVSEDKMTELIDKASQSTGSQYNG
ncbi:MAG: redoxin domain-containing protein [Solobacterium sp.]|jgi:cytochrome c-type biogenesis protein|nr:redoxin domain-containing protein [Solobacterium sp.]MCH4222397.1 redoxin domain-containing protein [Solobacterium sp.]